MWRAFLSGLFLAFLFAFSPSHASTYTFEMYLGSGAGIIFPTDGNAGQVTAYLTLPGTEPLAPGCTLYNCGFIDDFSISPYTLYPGGPSGGSPRAEYRMSFAGTPTDDSFVITGSPPITFSILPTDIGVYWGIYSFTECVNYCGGYQDIKLTLEYVDVVPLPATLPLFATMVGGLAVAAFARRRKRAA